MLLVTIACGTAAGSAAPPDPCAHSGAATSDATVTAAHHRAQCVIPTSVEGRRLFPCTKREPDVHVAAGSRLIIAPIRGVDNHRPHIGPVEHVVEADEGTQPQAPHGPVPSDAYIRGPPGHGARGEAGAHRVVDGEAGRVRLLQLRPRPARERGPRL